MSRRTLTQTRDLLPLVERCINNVPFVNPRYTSISRSFISTMLWLFVCNVETHFDKLNSVDGSSVHVGEHGFSVICSIPCFSSISFSILSPPHSPSSPSTLSVPYLHSFTLSFQCHTFRQQGWDVSATCPTFITPLDVWTTHHLGDGFLHAYTVWSKKLNFLYVLNNSVKITDYYSARRKSRLILTEL